VSVRGSVSGIEYRHFGRRTPAADYTNSRFDNNLPGLALNIAMSHEADDSTWQFLCGTTNRPADGRVIGLDCLLEIDLQLAGLADLPLG
jgi:hypothetical protein